jgi:hypothetical protein
MGLLSVLQPYLLVLAMAVGVRVPTEVRPQEHFQRLSALELYLAGEAHRRNLDPALVLAVVYQESRFKPRVVSHTSDYGLFQIHCGKDFSWCARFGVTPQQLLDPQVNLAYGFKIIEFCRAKAAGCEGPGCPHWLYYFNHSRQYVREVLHNRERYRKLLSPFFPEYRNIS